MDEIKVQKQNFDSGNSGSQEAGAGTPEQSGKSKAWLIAAIIVLVIVIAGAAVYYFLIMKNDGAQISKEAENLMGIPQNLPQVAGPQEPVPGSSDEISDINADLNAINFNNLDQEIQSAMDDINSVVE